MQLRFFTPALGQCRIRLWATGRYGFSVPKKIVISTPTGERSTYLYADRVGSAEFEVSNRSLIRIAIAQFIADPCQQDDPAEIDLDTPLFDGPLTRAPKTREDLALKVHPGKEHAQIRKNSLATRE